jgi:hypothetical protein
MPNQAGERMEEIRVAIRMRLQSVCAEWPAEAFDMMVDRLAHITLKYERVGSGNAYDRRNTDRLLADIKEVLEKETSERPDEHAS